MVSEDCLLIVINCAMEGSYNVYEITSFFAMLALLAKSKYHPVVIHRASK